MVGSRALFHRKDESKGLKVVVGLVVRRVKEKGGHFSS
jgi:hypothetical protein